MRPNSYAWLEKRQGIIIPKEWSFTILVESPFLYHIEGMVIPISFNFFFFPNLSFIYFFILFFLFLNTINAPLLPSLPSQSFSDNPLRLVRHLSTTLSQPSRVSLFSIVRHSHLSPEILSSCLKSDITLWRALPSASSSPTRFSDSPARLTVTPPSAVLAQIRHIYAAIPRPDLPPPRSVLRQRRYSNEIPNCHASNSDVDFYYMLIGRT